MDKSLDDSYYSISGKSVAITDQMSLKIKRKIEKNGGKTINFVNQEVDLLIVSGDDRFSDHQKEMAKMLNIPVLSESYFEKSLSTSRHLSPKRRRQSTSPIESKHKRKRKGSLPLTILDTPQPERPLLDAVIALEGNIGVGKSTLSAKFKTIFPKKCAIYKEKGNEKFLKLFYTDPKTYGFAFQWGMLKTRQYQLRLAQHDTKYGRIPPRQFYFWDRSMIGDYIFALLNHMLGSISENELAVYEDEFGGSINSLASISFFSAVNCYVLLNDEPENCKYRVEHLRGNQSESSIPLSYYENIDDLHYSLFVEHLLPLKIVNILFLTWGQYNDPKFVWDLLLNIISLKKELPYVKKMTSLPENLDPLNLIYRTCEEIEEFYKEMKQSEDSEKVKWQKTFKTVYVPMGIMIIQPEQITVNPYNIIFYRNEYKRVVLWHLSQFQNVCFYQPK